MDLPPSFSDNRWVVLFIVAVAFSIAGCGGSSSGSSVVDPEDAGSETAELASLEGRVTAPGGIVADFRAPSLLRYASEFFLPSAVAQITGLGAVIDAEVNLVRVNDDGERQGEPLATVKTDGDGNFEIPLEDALLASGDLMLQVVGQNDNLLRAPVVSSEVDVDPLSEFVIAKLLESGAGLASVNTGRLASLMAEVKKTELDFSDPNLTLEIIRGELEEKLGDVVKAQVDAATKKAGPGDKIAGTYDSVGIGFGFRDNYPSYTFADFVISYASKSDMQASGLATGDFEWLLSGGLSGYVTVPVSDNGGPPYLDIDDDKSKTTFEGVFGDDLVSRILLPAREDSYKAGDGEVFGMSPPRAFVNQSSADFSTAVNSWRTNEERVYVGPDGDRRQDGRTLERYLEVFLHEPENLRLEDMVGTFGFVSLNSDGFSTTSGMGGSATQSSGYSIFSEIGTLKIGESGMSEYREITSSGVAAAVNGKVAAYSDGTLTVEADQLIVEHIVNKAFSLIAHGNVSGTQDPFILNTRFSLGVRLPKSGESPELAGRHYRVSHLAVNGDVSKDFERTNVRSVESVDFDTFITFDENENASFSGALETVALANDPQESGNLKIQVEKQRWSDRTAEVDLGDNGRLEISYSTSGSNRVLDGFINSDGSMAVLRLSEPDTESKAVLGFVLLVEVAPEVKTKNIINN